MVVHDLSGSQAEQEIAREGSVSGSLHRARDCLRIEQEIARKGLVSGGVWVNLEQEIACERSVSESHAEQGIAREGSRGVARVVRGQVSMIHRARNCSRGVARGREVRSV